MSYINAELNFTSLNGLDLSNRDFTNARIQNTSINNTNFENANFTNLYTKRLSGNPLKLPNSYSLIGNATNGFVIIGPNVNLQDIVLQNLNLNNLNLTGVNLTNATLDNVTLDGTILDQAVLNGVISSNITGTPKSLPIGTFIENRKIIYTQDNIYYPLNPLNSIVPSKFNNTIIPNNLTQNNKNIIFGGIIQNNEQFLLIYISQDFSSSVNFVPNTIYIYSISNQSIVSNFQVPNFFFTALSASKMFSGKGGFLFGYGYVSSLNNPIVYITVRLNENGTLDTMYEGTGYKIQQSPFDRTLLPTGKSENLYTNPNLNYFITQSTNNNVSLVKNIFEFNKNSVGINFSGKNLSGLDLSGVDFSGCNFTNTNLSYTNLTNSNLSNCTFINTNLSYANLTNVNLLGSTFDNCNFVGIFISGIGQDVQLPGGFKVVNGLVLGPYMNLDGIDLSGVNLSNINFTGTTFRNAILTNTNISGVNFTNTIFDNATTGRMSGTPILLSLKKYKLINGFIVGPYINLNNANLSGADLSSLDLVGIKVNGANLTNCILTNTRSRLITGTPLLSSNTKLINGHLIGNGAILNGANLSGGNILGVDISNTNLTDANFYDVKSGQVTGIPNLSSEYKVINGYLVGPNVDLSGVDLSGVDLTNMNIMGANVNGTKLSFTNLNNLTSGQLRGTAVLNSNYRLLNGYIVGPNVNLMGADLTNVNLSMLNLNGTNLENTIFKNVQSGSITGIPLFSSNYKLLNGYLVGPEVDLSGANLERQNLNKMNLLGANFTNANLKFSVFTESNIQGTNFSGIQFDGIISGKLIGVPSSLPSNLNIFEVIFQKQKSRFFIGPSINLSNIEFANMDLSGLNFSNSILNGSYINNTNIQNLNLDKCILNNLRSKNVSGIPLNLPIQWKITNGYMIGPKANLMYSDFTNLDLSGTYLTDTTLLQVNFNNTVPGPILGEPVLEYFWKSMELPFGSSKSNFIIGPDMNLGGIDFTNQDLSNFTLKNIKINSTTKFTNANLTNVVSGGIIGKTEFLPKEWKIINGYLVGPAANLSLSELTRFNLENLNLNYVNFYGANLQGTSLLNSTLKSVISGEIKGVPILPDGWILYNGYLIGPEADLTNANLEGINLEGLDLSGVNFSGANLQNANFTNTNITNAKFWKADLTNIVPISIYDQIDLTGVILPLNNYYQFNYFISSSLPISDFVKIRYNEVKQKIFDKLFSNQNIKDDIPIIYIKRVNSSIYRELFILYSENYLGSDNETYFDQLKLSDIDSRIQIHERTIGLIGNKLFVDDFLLRLMNRFDIDTIPENILRNINFKLATESTVSEFLIKHLFDSKFHSLILAQMNIIDIVKSYFRKVSKLFDDNMYVNNLYNSTNNNIDNNYQNIVRKYRNQVEFFEMYLYSEDILNEFTNASEIARIFQKMVNLSPKYVTPVLLDLFKKITTKLFGPVSPRDNFDLYKLDDNRLFISVDFEMHFIKQFILKNKDLVEQIFMDDQKLKTLWTSIQIPDIDPFILSSIYPWCKTIEISIIYFRSSLFTTIKNRTYTDSYPNDLTKGILSSRKADMDGFVNMTDENLNVIDEYLKDNIYVRQILENPQAFLDDVYKSNYSSIEDITKLYGFSSMITPQIKTKILEYDIRNKLEQNELRYMRLFSGLSSNLLGDEKLIAPLEDYRNLWKSLMN
jgi:uncharacterized protein YjbI with pentapeptide repeats